MKQLTWFDWTNFYVGVAGLVLGVVGLVIAALSFLKAASAKAAVDAVLKRYDQHGDLERMRKLIARLSGVKRVALRRWNGAPKALQAGFSRTSDFAELQEAEDALKTFLVPASHVDLATDLQGAANELGQAIVLIVEKSSGRDGWKDALSTLQVILPRLEQVEHELVLGDLRVTKEL